MYQLFLDKSLVFQACFPQTWQAEFTNQVMWYTQIILTPCSNFIWMRFNSFFNWGYTSKRKKKMKEISLPFPKQGKETLPWHKAALPKQEDVKCKCFGWIYKMAVSLNLQHCLVLHTAHEYTKTFATYKVMNYDCSTCQEVVICTLKNYCTPHISNLIT